MQQESGAQQPGAQESGMQDFRAEALYCFRVADPSLETRVWPFRLIDILVLQEAMSRQHDEEFAIKTLAIRETMLQTLHAWKLGDPAQCHTAAGLLALKLKLKAIMRSVPGWSKESAAALRICDEADRTIARIMPEKNAEALKGVEAVISQRRTIEAVLTQNPDADIDAALHELQLTLSREVSAEFRHNATFAGYLAAAGVPDWTARIPALPAIEAPEEEPEPPETRAEVLYRLGAADVWGDKTILNVKPFVDDVALAYFSASVVESTNAPQAAEIFSLMTDELDDWNKREPAVHHTVAGVFALLQRLKRIRSGAAVDATQRDAADRVYDYTRQALFEVLPRKHAKAINGIESAAEQLDDIESTLTRNPNADIGEALRKLQTTLSRDVNPDFAASQRFGESLAAAGVPHLNEYLAEQALQATEPRGSGEVLKRAWSKVWDKVRVWN